MASVLTSEQRAALETLRPLFTGTARAGVLTGSAGTGKTFLVSTLLEGLIKRDWEVVVLTPTGRAADVLRTSLQRMAELREVAMPEIVPRTIHSFIYRMQPPDYAGEQLSLFAETTQPETSGEPTLWVIDEASMVGNTARAADEVVELCFGSGSLLHDLVEAADLESNSELRLLFVGDSGQLPPIQPSASENDAPALTAAALREALPPSLRDEPIPVAELTEVRRQTQGPLLQFIHEVRSAMRDGGWLPTDARPQVQPLRNGDWLKKYLVDTDNGQAPARAILLSHTNASVRRYNQAVRVALGRDDVTLHPDEVLLVRRNRSVNLDHGELGIGFDEVKFKNGSFIQVVGLPRIDRQAIVPLRGGEVTLVYWRAQVRLVNEAKMTPVEVVVLANRLRPPTPTSAENLDSALLIDFQRRMLAEHDLPPQSPGSARYEEYHSRVQSDPYFNCIQAEYGYAVTVHNAQGGEWPSVLIDPGSNKAREWQRVPKHREAYARWVYTAITRASEEVSFIHESSFDHGELPLHPATQKPEQSRHQEERQ